VTHDVLLLVIAAVGFASLGRGYRQGQGPIWVVVTAIALFVLVAAIAILDLAGA